MTYLDPIRNAPSERLQGLHPELLDLYTLLALSSGYATNREDVHNAWSLWVQRTRPDHPSLIPFADLDPEVQELDEKYVEAIHAAVKAVHG